MLETSVLLDTPIGFSSHLSKNDVCISYTVVALLLCTSEGYHNQFVVKGLHFKYSSLFNESDRQWGYLFDSIQQDLIISEFV